MSGPISAKNDVATARALVSRARRELIMNAFASAVSISKLQ